MQTVYGNEIGSPFGQPMYKALSRVFPAPDILYITLWDDLSSDGD